MAKAILVMDMPERCIDCPCECDGYCQTEGAVKGIVESVKKKPSWCPLKPMPEKKAVMNHMDDEVYLFRRGFNACIDAICGKE